MVRDTDRGHDRLMAAQESEPDGVAEELRRDAAERLRVARAATDRGAPWHLRDLTTIDALLKDAAVIVVDLGGVVTHWGAGAEDLYGYATDEAVGRVLLDLIVASQDRPIGERMRDCLHRTGTWESDFWVRHKDGTRFLVYVSGTTVEDDDERPAACIGISYEIPMGMREATSDQTMPGRVPTSLGEASAPVSRFGDHDLWNEFGSANDALRGAIGYGSASDVANALSALAVAAQALAGSIRATRSE